MPPRGTETTAPRECWSVMSKTSVGSGIHRASRPTWTVADEPRDDIELIRCTAAGDQHAFEALFRRHATTLAAQIVRLVGGHAEAEEVVQETFLQLWQQSDRFLSSRCSVAGWLCVLARSRALDRVRARLSRTRRECQHAVEAEPLQAIPPTALRELQAAESRQRLLSAMTTLPSKQRLCVELAYFQGLSQRQIAEQLCEPLGTVKSRVLLGVRKLRQVLVAVGKLATAH